MKYNCLLAALLAITITGQAQNGLDSRIYKLSNISYGSTKVAGSVRILTGGDSLLVANRTSINPSSRTIDKLDWYMSHRDYSLCSFSAFQETLLRSHNGRFAVIQCVGCNEILPDKSGSTTFSNKRKTRTHINRGIATSAKDTGWTWCSIEKDYVLAVTNAGKLLVTEPGSIDLEKNSSRNVVGGEVNKMRNLWLFDPASGERKIIIEGLIKDGRGKDPQVLVNAAGTRVFFVTGPLNPHAFLYDVAAEKSVEIPWSNNCLPKEIGNSLLLVAEKEKSMVYRMSDGAKLLEHMPADSMADDLYLTENDELCIYNTGSGTVAIFSPAGDEMKLKERLVLEQNGIISKEMKYSFLIMNKHIALFPMHMPMGMRSWPDGFDWNWGAPKKEVYPIFFDRKTGKATSAVMPYFTMAPTKAENEAANKRRCSEMQTMMTIKPGSLVCSKNSKYELAHVFSGPDCQKLAYKLDNISGNGGYWVYNLNDYEVCAAPGTFTVCSKCKGVPRSTSSITVADDGWKQVNFNIYVRNPNATKVETVEFNCDLCKGKGYLKK